MSRDRSPGDLCPLGMKVARSLRWHLGGPFGFRPSREKFLRDLPKDAVCAEIGVFRGEFSRAILEVTRPRHLHLVDGWWELYGERYPDWGAYTDFGHLPTRKAYEDTMTAIDRYAGGAQVSVHVGDDCVILESFPDGYFDWVYLDSSHQYQETVRELEILARKVRRGGIIAGDDWKDDPDDPNHGASVAIREFCRDRGWQVDKRDDYNQWRISKAPRPR
jgi:hypothetical protein